jgi:hypothetical protein
VAQMEEQPLESRHIGVKGINGTVQNVPAIHETWRGFRTWTRYLPCAEPTELQIAGLNLGRFKPAFAERYNKQTPGSGFFRILDLGSRISCLGSRISKTRSRIPDLGFPDLGSRMSDLGSRIPNPYF